LTTLLALYRRPEGGPDELASFERAYSEEHLPNVALTPGLEGLRVQRITDALGGETDFILAATMDFRDRATMDEALASEPMREAGRSLRRIAPGLSTLLVLEAADDLMPEGWS
jgi:uncharacterized protein (TIGR02118 family)